MSHFSNDVNKDKVYEEFNAVVAETEGLLKSLASAGSETAGALRADFDESLAAAIEAIARIREKALGHASDAAQATDAYVKENPWRAIGIAAAVAASVGLVAGVLVARR